MIDTDRLELIDTGDGVPLTKCEQNLYEALANVEDGIVVTRTKTRLEDALADMSELVAEVRRLREEMRRLYDAWFDDEGMSQDAHETLMTELFVELMG